jgi:CRP/FNR family transcriptional regulator, cyclic AMP receptor protein
MSDVLLMKSECQCETLAGDTFELSPVCFGNLWLFQHLKPDDLQAVLQSAIRRKMIKGSLLFRQGEPADEIFLIKGGRLKLSKVFEDGREITLDYLKPGDFVGEALLSTSTDYPFSALCLEDSLTCGFSRKLFEQLVLTRPHIGLQIICNMSERITALTDRLGGFAAGSIEERLHKVLTDLAREHGIEHPRGRAIQFYLSHEDLGFLVGAHRVSVTRALKELKQTGKIFTDGRNLIVPLPAE